MPRIGERLTYAPMGLPTAGVHGSPVRFFAMR